MEADHDELDGKFFVRGQRSEVRKEWWAMEMNEASDLVRHTLMMALLVASPMLVIGLVVGLIVSLVQAVTQIQEPTLAFVPKIFAMAIAVVFVMPWMFQRLLEYTHHLVTMGN